MDLIQSLGILAFVLGILSMTVWATRARRRVSGDSYVVYDRLRLRVQKSRPPLDCMIVFRGPREVCVRKAEEIEKSRGLPLA